MDVRQLIRKLITEQLNEANIKTPIKDLPAVQKTAGENDTIEITSEERLAEILDKNSELKDYIGDFLKSDAPQFDGKSDDKKRNMAIAAYLNEKKVDEGTCGYGIDGKIGNTPSGPKLRNK